MFEGGEPLWNLQERVSLFVDVQGHGDFLRKCHLEGARADRSDRRAMGSTALLTCSLVASGPL